MIDFIFLVKFLTGFLISVSMFLIVNLLIRIMKIRNHAQRSNLYLFALLSSFSIMLYALFFFDIKRKGNSLVLLLPNQMRWLEDTLKMSINSMSEGFRFFDFKLALLILFIFSLAVFFSILFFSRFYIIKKYNLKSCKDERVLPLLKNIHRENGARIPQAMTFRGDINAFIFGFPPILAISEELLRNVNEKELRLILRHEMNHIQNHDNILKPFLFSLQVLFFYNPCVHILSQGISKEREFIADKVSDAKKERIFFLYTLVKLSELRGPNKSFLPSFISSPLVKSNLKMRTETLLSEEKRPRGSTYLLSVWIFLILLVIGVYVSGNLLQKFPLHKIDAFLGENACKKHERENSFLKLRPNQSNPEYPHPLAFERVAEFPMFFKSNGNHAPPDSLPPPRPSMMIPFFYIIDMKTAMAAILLFPFMLKSSEILIHLVI